MLNGVKVPLTNQIQTLNKQISENASDITKILDRGDYYKQIGLYDSAIYDYKAVYGPAGLKPDKTLLKGKVDAFKEKSYAIQ